MREDDKEPIKEFNFLKEESLNIMGRIIQHVTEELALEMNKNFLNLLIKIVYHVSHKKINEQTPIWVYLVHLS